MAEVLVIGKKISEMGLVNEITGEEKIPTSALGDKAVTTSQLLTYVNNNGVAQWGRIGGDIANQSDLQNQFAQQLTTLQNHIQDQGNPHNVTKEQVGLGLVDNTADMDKPVSTAVQEALSLKADQTYVDDSLVNKTHNSLLGRDADGAHPAGAILDGSGVTQQQVNDLTGAPYRVRVSGYDTGERVVLADSDIVKSIVDGNTNNPNVDMTGWVKVNTASQIFDASGKSQQEVNDNQTDKNLEILSINDYRKYAIGDHWTEAFEKAVYDMSRWGITRLGIGDVENYYIVKDIPFEAYWSLEGIGAKARRYDPSNLEGMRKSRCIVFDTTGEFCIDFGGRNVIKELNFYGMNRACDGIGVGSKSGMRFENVGMFRFNVGFGTSGGYMQSMTAFQIMAAGNNTGIRNPIDATITNPTINNNDVGISLQTGANDNTFIGGKSEWNRLGWSIYQAHHNTINGGVTDRSRGDYNFSIKQSSLIINGHWSRRASTTNETTSSHFLLEANDGLELNGLKTKAGKNDDGAGLYTPAYIFNVEKNSGHVNIIGGDYLGRTVGLSRGGTLNYSAKGAIGVRDTLDNYGRLGSSIAASDSSELIIDTGLNMSNYNPQPYKFRIYASTRNSAGVLSTNEFSLLLTRAGAGNATAVLDNILDDASVKINVLDAELNVSIQSVTENGSQVVLKVENTSANSLQTRIDTRLLN